MEGLHTGVRAAKTPARKKGFPPTTVADMHRLMEEFGHAHTHGMRYAWDALRIAATKALLYDAKSNSEMLNLMKRLHPEEHAKIGMKALCRMFTSELPPPIQVVELMVGRLKRPEAWMRAVTLGSQRLQAGEAYAQVLAKVREAVVNNQDALKARRGARTA